MRKSLSLDLLFVSMIYFQISNNLENSSGYAFDICYMFYSVFDMDIVCYCYYCIIVILNIGFKFMLSYYGQFFN